MKKIFFALQITAAVSGISCSNGQTKTKLNATEFNEKMKELPYAPVIDVRTQEEFSDGHIANALNMDWNGNDFQSSVSKMDKTAPVMVYCLSGGRSAAAATSMRSMGFKEIYELDGGIMKWRAANLPLSEGATIKAPGMTMEQYNQLINSSDKVLVDFYAEWCAPCKKMKPFLDEIAEEMKPSLKVIRINVDENIELCKELKVDALPVLFLYENKNLVWSNLGFIDKDELLNHLK